jgi:hypothetical protein
MKKLIKKIKIQQDLDVQGCADLKALEIYIERLEFKIAMLEKRKQTMEHYQ